MAATDTKQAQAVLSQLARTVATNAITQAEAQLRTRWNKHNPPEEFTKAYDFNPNPEAVMLVFDADSKLVAWSVSRTAKNQNRINHTLTIAWFLSDDPNITLAFTGSDFAVVERFIQKLGRVTRRYMYYDVTTQAYRRRP